MIYIKGEKIHTNNRCAFVCLRFLLKSWHEAQFTRNHRNSACCLLTALRMSGYWEPWQCPARPCSTEPQLPAAAVWSRLGAARRGVLPPAGQRGLELFPIVVVNVSRRTRLHLQQSAATPADEASLTGQSWEHQGAHRRLRWPRGRVHGERKEVRGPADIPGSIWLSTCCGRWWRCPRQSSWPNKRKTTEYWWTNSESEDLYSPPKISIPCSFYLFIFF